MFHLTGRRSLAVVPVILAGLMLAACSSPSAEKSLAPDAGANDAAAAQFVSCLTDQDQTAKLLIDGSVGILQPEAGDQGGQMALGGGSGQGSAVIIQDGDDSWLVGSSADAYPEEGGARAAWKTCAKKVPDFTQKKVEMGGDKGSTQKLGMTSDDLKKAGLDFARCARENGYADFADPDAEGQIELPDGITEDEADALLKACAGKSDDAIAPALSQESMNALGFDWAELAAKYYAGGITVGSIGGGAQ